MSAFIRIFVSIVLLLLLSGCAFFDDTSVAERVAVSLNELPDITEADYMQTSIRFQPQIPSIALRLEAEAQVDRQTWTFPVTQALTQQQFGSGSQQQQMEYTITTPSGGQTAEMRQGRQAPGMSDIILTEHLNQITNQSGRAAWNGHVFYVLSVATDSQNAAGEPERHHRVLAMDENGRGAASFRTGQVQRTIGPNSDHPGYLPPQPLQYSLVKNDDGIWIVYRETDGIYARRLVLGNSGSVGAAAGLLSTGESFSFSEPVKVSSAARAYGDFQLISRTDRNNNLHVIWTDTRDKSDLWYCRYSPGTGEACRRPNRLSRSITSDPVNLMISGDELYISWIDSRFETGWWSKRNYAKLFLVKSSDLGRTFGSPVTIHPPDDANQVANFALTMPAPAPNGGVLVFWSREWRGSPNTLNRDLYYGHLQPDMQTLLLADAQVPGEELYESLRERLVKYYRGMASSRD